MRRLSAGAECMALGGVDFRVWAPGHAQVELCLETPVRERYPLQPDADGYFSARIDHAGPGSLYRYLIDGQGPFPDPSSRFQPEGSHGVSEVIDAGAYTWNDHAWRGITLRGQVFYELHVGTFTPQGTFASAETKLPHLRDLGVTTIELMPVGDFAGDFGWGYDGVGLYAPYRRYGRPDDLRKFVDAAHQLQLGVILDVVYNHLGPTGNYLSEFSANYFSKQGTEWGSGLNFDEDRARPVRDWVCENAAYWVREFHIDGLRLDATQCLFDNSSVHIVTELTQRARAEAATQRRTIVVVGENEPQSSKLLHAVDAGGYGLDGLWNDDFHHSAVVALTGRREAYYRDYAGHAQELVAAAKHGFLYQGQYYHWQKRRRGSSTRGLASHRFIAYLENHDQIANSAACERLFFTTHPATYRAMTALLLLGPWTPLLFQGQEWSSARPFPYFAQHTPDLAPLVKRGRSKSLAQFASLASREVQAAMPDPGARATFESAKLDWATGFDSVLGQRSLRLHRDLLQLRHDDPVLRPGSTAVEFASAALSDTCLLLRWFASDRRDRLLLVNLASDLPRGAAPEPLLAPPDGHSFRLLWSSEHLSYGGLGQPDDATDAQGFAVPAHAALLFEAATAVTAGQT